jgi:class 3 adenylate cyclase
MNNKKLIQKQKRLQRDNLKKVNLLALILNFEKYWQSYSLSDGDLYAKQVREEAHKIMPIFYEVFGKKAVVGPDGKVNDVDLFESRRFIWELEKWLGTKDKFPKVLFGREYTNRSQFVFQYVFIELESQLQNEIGLPLKLSFAMTPHENYFRRKQLKWAGQFPDDLVEKAMDPSFIMQMSNTDTLVMVADIRRSQDLITYGLSPDFYREQIIGFLSEVRKILRNNYGIYDRFTGDGFIAYFNQFVCEQEGRDYYEMTLDASEKIQTFSEQYFENWSSQIRKIPVEPIGLSLGIDSGVVNFKDIEGQFFAIGDACVWATRMCNAGKRGETIFNNIPYHKISAYGKDGFCKEIDAVTKNGETFKAYSVNPSLITYKTLPKKDPSLDKPTAIS